MGTIRSLISELRSISVNMRVNVRIALYKEAAILRNDFKARSPVDTGRYRDSWKIARDRFSSGNTLASVSIYNDTPYGEYMEYGAAKNQAPWYYPGSRKRRTGKLALRNNRVWAGGLLPGHSATVNGAIDPVIFNNERRLRKLANIIGDSAIRGFKK